MTLTPTPDFADFYRAEWRRVLSLVYVLSGSSWGAEDIAQDAFLRAHRNWDEVGRYEHPGAWVRTVALNLARSRMRRAGAELRALRRWIGLQAVAFPELEPVSEEFWAAVRSLPQRQREAVALHYAEDRSVEDIAAVLGVSESTVKTSLQKGRASLARRFGELEGTP
ncbi:MAG: SigE family RNA polymerase sigma factor [Acidimicrobiia bacterium]|nr:SigE family RNA polymerase sigma factor [Acidimicrobiia bacterium]